MGGLHVFVTGTLVATRIVPEPSTLVLAFAAFAGLLAVGARRQAGRGIANRCFAPRRISIAGRVIRKVITPILRDLALILTCLLQTLTALRGHR